MDIEEDVNDEKEIIEEGDDEIELEIVDDTPDEDKKYKGKTKKEVLGEDDDDPDGEDDEAKNYSDRVKKRINQLKYEFHEERRAREAAEREREEAFSYAERQRKEVEKLRTSAKDGAGQAFKNAEQRIAAEMLVASRDLREALDSGESDKAVEAQTKIASLAAEKARLEAYQESSREQKVEEDEPPKRQQPQRQQPSNAAREWANRNPWFNSDDRMTAYAFGVHKHLIEREGVKPDTDEYYSAIDKEMKKVFPSYFNNDKDEDTPATVVAAPSKTPRKKPRTIRLTQSQVNLAKRLGITPEAYAAELMKDQKHGS